MPSLSVVICAYTLDRWDDLQAAVQSVREQTVPIVDLVIVVDHNEELLRRCREVFEVARVLANTGPQGLSGGRNTGAAVCTGDVVAFVDDDARAEPDWAERLLNAYVDESVVGVGGSVVPDWRTPRPDWFPEEFLWVVGCSYLGQPRGRAEVRNAIGANMSFRRSVLERTSGFDVGIGRVGKDTAGCEETELSLRAAATRPGGRVLLEPSAVVHHTVTPGRATRDYFRARCRGEGRSKALVAEMAGPQQALSSERTYTTRTLPRGVAAGLRRAASGDRAGLRTAWAICEGFVLTASAYARTRAVRHPALARADRRRP